MTSHSHTGPLSSSKPIPSSAYIFRRDADAFTPKSSPTTLYHEIKSSPPLKSQNRASSSSDSVFQIAAALAKVTQLQRLPKGKSDIFTSDETDTKFFVWKTAFDALIDSAPISAQQKLYFLYQHLDGNVKTTTETKSTTTACTQVCGEEKTSRLCARIVLVPAYHQSNPATKITTYAILDDQSPDAFISEALLEQLEVDAQSSAQTRLEPRK